MRIAMGVLTIGFGLIAASAAYAQDAKVAAGIKVYEAQKCAMCHAIEGKGNKKFPLDGVGTKLNADQIREWIVDPKSAATKAKSDAKPPMKAYPNLSAADLDAVVAYMVSLKK